MVKGSHYVIEGTLFISAQSGVNHICRLTHDLLDPGLLGPSAVVAIPPPHVKHRFDRATLRFR